MGLWKSVKVKSDTYQVDSSGSTFVDIKKLSEKERVKYVVRSLRSRNKNAPREARTATR
jgi:hypothetical protein